MKLFCLLLRFFGFGKWAAALENGVQGYQTAVRDEEAEAAALKEAELTQVRAKTQTQEEQAHEEVVNAADPDAVVDEQLHELGLVAEDKDVSGGAGPDASAPADHKTQAG